MSAPLGPRPLVAYGLVTLPLAIAGLPLALYVPPFYTQELGLDLTAVGVVLMLARVTDVFTDPMIGVLSDRFPTRWGRRRPWVLAGTPVMMLGTWKLFVPPPGVGPWYLLLWISVLYLGWTLVGIPYGAWGAELSSDYHERSRITGVREMCGVVGLIVAATVPYAIALAGGVGLAPGLHALATLTVASLPIGTGLLLLFVPEPSPPPEGSGALGWRHGLALVWRNEPFKRLLAAAVLGGLAASINQSLAVLFFIHVLRLTGVAQGLVLVYFLAGVLAVPFWVWLSNRTSKHRALAYAGFWGCGWFLLAPLLPPGHLLPVFWLNVATGMTMAVPQVLGGSMAADVVDLDTLESGEGRAALFFALWSMGTKMALAFGVGIALPLLDLSGFTAAGPNGPSQLFALTALYCLVPVAIWLLSIWPIWRFPIGPERQAALRHALARRAVAS